MSFFNTIQPLPEDSVFGPYAAFQADPRAEKVNLAVGIFMNEEGQVPLLKSVERAEAHVLKLNKPKSYLPIEGDPAFIQEALHLVYGPSLPPVLAVQALGGTGGLRLGAEFLKAQGVSSISLPNPSWANHVQIFSRAHFQISHYPYYEAKKCQFALQNLPAQSLVLFHVCCHNPTGIDPTFEEWKEMAHIVKAAKLLPFFDFAYQGFAEGISQDAAPLHLFIEEEIPFIVSSSFSKNFALYGERVGLLSFVHFPPATLTHLKALIRAQYSNPPLHGAQIVTSILQSEPLRTLWMEDLSAMRERLIKMRQGLLQILQDKGFESLKRQRGLFFMTGLNRDQIHQLREKNALYLLENGRLSLSGLNEKNLRRVAEALLSVL